MGEFDRYLIVQFGVVSCMKWFLRKAFQNCKLKGQHSTILLSIFTDYRIFHGYFT